MVLAWTATPLSSPVIRPVWGQRTSASSPRKRWSSACWANTDALHTLVSPVQLRVHDLLIHSFCGFVSFSKTKWMIDWLIDKMDINQKCLSVMKPCQAHFCTLFITGFCQSSWFIYTQELSFWSTHQWDSVPLCWSWSRVPSSLSPLLSLTVWTKKAAHSSLEIN